jgi:hypothetical protein
MRRKRLIEMLENIEIVRCEKCGGVAYRLSGKSCQDIADFVQEEIMDMKRQAAKVKG